MKRSYAVVWSSNADVNAGRLEPLADRFELYGRERRLSVRFADLTSAAIARRRDDRLLGLPVLALAVRGRPPLRIASLDGPGFLQELAERVEAGGRPVAAA
jgi:hypothetical protein